MALYSFDWCRMPDRISGEEEAIERMLTFVRSIDGRSGSPEWGRASSAHEHLGAKLADAVLQAGVNYERMVRPRVEALAVIYPKAAVLSGLKRVIKNHGAPRVLQMNAGAKPATFRALVFTLEEMGVETVSDLRELVSDRWRANALRRIKGVGPKTVAFLKLVVDLDALAVDQHILRAMDQAGVPPCDPSEAEWLLSKVAQRLGCRLADLDAMIWQYQSALAARPA